jgi:hypothetical protein
VTIKTAAGPVHLSAQAARHHRGVRVPAVRIARDQDERPETLVIASFVRGLSVRDVEAAQPKRSVTRQRFCPPVRHLRPA